jgi:hypothetical protein
VCSFKEAVKSDEECVGGKFPAILSLRFILKVGILEFGTDINTLLEFLTGLICFLVSNKSKNTSSIDE